MQKLPIRALLIEDDEDDFILIRSLLSEITSERYELEWVDTYDTALDRIGCGQYDVHLLDYHLGERNGLDILHGMAEGLHRAPIIFLTGHGDYRVDMEAMKAGAVDYLDKSELHAALLERSIRYAIEGVKVKKALEWELETNAALAEISKAFLTSETLSIEEFSYLVLQHAKRLTGSKFGYVGYIDPETGCLVCPTMTKEDCDICRIGNKDTVFKKFGGLWGWVLENRKHLLTNSPIEDMRSPGTPSLINRFLSSPALLGSGELVGQVALANSDDDYTGLDLKFVDRLADLYAGAIQRMRAQEILQKREYYFRSLLFNMHEDVFVIDRNFSIIDINRDVLLATGHRRDEVIGHYCYEVTHGLPKPCREYGVECKLHKVFEDGGLLSCRHEHIHENGSKVWVDVLLSPLKDDLDRITHVIEAVRNVTAEVDLERRFRRAQRMESIATLCGGIAHDFNNILTPIMGYAEVALLDVRKGILPTESDLQRVLKAAGRAGNLVKQILTFSRQTEQEKQPIRISLIIKEALKLLRASLPSTIEVQDEIVSKGEILGDSTQIHQIVMNLCTNAAHAMRGRKGVLRVRLEDVHLDARTAVQYHGIEPGPYLRLIVGDTGHGIDPVIKEKIFDPFFTTKAPGEGTGLGLSVTHGIVKSHGGAITVYSELYQGTTFQVLLPMLEGAASETPVEVRPVPRGTERVLYVDDEPTIAQLGQRMLERLGYRVVAKTGSFEALEAFRNGAGENKFDLVITDMTMPAMTGIELAGEILRIQPDMPIILCTGFSEAASIERARLAGIRGVVMKPMVMRKLAEIARDVLDNKDRSLET